MYTPFGWQCAQQCHQNKETTEKSLDAWVFEYTRIYNRIEQNGNRPRKKNGMTNKIFSRDNS